MSTSYPKPNRESLDSIKDADRIIADGEPGYASASDMFAAMGV